MEELNEEVVESKKGLTGRSEGKPTILIPGEIESVSKRGVTVAAGTVYDYKQNKFQQDINEEVVEGLQQLTDDINQNVKHTLSEHSGEIENINEALEENIPYVIVYENQTVNIPCDPYGNYTGSEQEIGTVVKLYRGNIQKEIEYDNSIVIESPTDKGFDTEVIEDDGSAIISIPYTDISNLDDTTEVDFHILSEGKAYYGKVIFNKVKQGKSAYEEWKDLHPEIENPTPARFISDLKNVDGVYGPKYAPNETAAIADADGATVIYFIPNSEDTTKYDIILVEDGEAKPLAQEVSGDITNYAGIYDVSEDNKTGSTPKSYPNLSDAIADIVTKGVGKGGMTIKYIGTDGKYHQYRYTLADLSGFSNKNNWEESTQASDLGDKEIDSGITLGSISTKSPSGITVVKGTNKVTITGTSFQGRYGAFWNCSSLEDGKEYHIRFHAVTTNGSNAANWRLMRSSKAASSDSDAVVQTLNTTYHTAGEEDIDVTFTFDATKPYIGFLNWQSSSIIHLQGGSSIVITDFSIISIQDGIEKKITSLEDAVESLDDFKNSLVDGSGVDGKVLSSNDFTDEYKQAVEGIGQGGDSSEVQEVVLGKEIDSGIQQDLITAANTTGISLNVTASKVTITGSTYTAMYGAFWDCSSLENNKEYHIRFHVVTTDGTRTADWRLMMSSSKQSSNTGVTLKPLSGIFHQAGEEDIDEVFTFKSSTPYIGFLNYETYQANTVIYNNLRGGCKVVVTNFSIVEIQKGLVDDVKEIKEEIDNISDNIDLTPINTKIASVAKPLSNKNIAILGDSITNVGYYANAFLAITGYSHKVVCGKDGAAWVYRSGQYEDYDVKGRIDAMVTAINGEWIPDIIIIALGRNDYGNSLTIGTPTAAIWADDETIALRGTMHNSIRYAVKRLRSLYPDVKIFLQGIQWAGKKNIGVVDSEDKFRQRTEKVILYDDNIRLAAKYNGCSFIDVMSDGVCEDTNSRYTSDHLHDNADGGAVHGRCVAAAVLAQYGITFTADRL